MKKIILCAVIIAGIPIAAYAEPYQILANIGYRPQITTSRIDYDYLSSFDGFVDVPPLGIKILKPLRNEWYIAASYRYFHEKSGIGNNNKVTLNQHVITIGPYYRSPTTETGNFYINLSAYISYAITHFDSDVGNVTDRLHNNGIALMATIGVERRIYHRFTIFGELNYSAPDYKLSGNIGQSPISVEPHLHSSGLDLDAGLGYEFAL